MNNFQQFRFEVTKELLSRVRSSSNALYKLLILWADNPLYDEKLTTLQCELELLDDYFIEYCGLYSQKTYGTYRTSFQAVYKVLSIEPETLLLPKFEANYYKECLLELDRLFSMYLEIDAPAYVEIASGTDLEKQLLKEIPSSLSAIGSTLHRLRFRSTLKLLTRFRVAAAAFLHLMDTDSNGGDSVIAFSQTQTALTELNDFFVENSGLYPQDFYNRYKSIVRLLDRVIELYPVRSLAHPGARLYMRSGLNQLGELFRIRLRLDINKCLSQLT